MKTRPFLDWGEGGGDSLDQGMEKKDLLGQPPGARGQVYVPALLAPSPFPAIIQAMGGGGICPLPLCF